MLLELPLTVKLPGAVSASPTVNGIAPVEVFTTTVWLVMSEIVGGELGGLTVKRKVSFVLFTPSVTVTVTIEEPV